MIFEMYFLPFSLYLSGNKIYEIHLRTMKNTHETDLIQFFASCQYISIKVDLCLHFIGLVCPENDSGGESSLFLHVLPALWDTYLFSKMTIIFNFKASKSQSDSQQIWFRKIWSVDLFDTAYGLNNFQYHCYTLLMFFTITRTHDNCHWTGDLCHSSLVLSFLS